MTLGTFSLAVEIYSSEKWLLRSFAYFLNWVVCLNYQVVKVISSRYKFVKTSRGLSFFFFFFTVPLSCLCIEEP